MRFFQELKNIFTASRKIASAETILNSLEETTPDEAIEDALLQLEQCLTILTPEAHPDLWATAHQLTDTARLALGQRGDAKHLPFFIETHQRLLDEARARGEERTVVSTLFLIGVAYEQHYIREAGATNEASAADSFDHAARAFEQALSLADASAPSAVGELIRSRQASLYMSKWSASGRTDGESAERATLLFEEALKRLGAEDEREQRGAIHAALGLLYAWRKEGNPGENAALAAQHFERAQQTGMMEASPELDAVLRIQSMRAQATGFGSRRERLDAAEAQMLQLVELLSQGRVADEDVFKATAMGAIWNYSLSHIAPTTFGDAPDPEEMQAQMEMMTELLSDYPDEPGFGEALDLLRASTRFNLEVVRILQEIIGLLTELPEEELNLCLKDTGAFDFQRLAPLVRARRPDAMESLWQEIEQYERALADVEGLSVPGIDLLAAAMWDFEMFRCLFFKYRIFPERTDPTTKAEAFAHYEKSLPALSQAKDPYVFYNACAVWGQVAFFNEGLWTEAERAFQLALDVQEKLYDSASAGKAKQDALVGVSSVKHNVVLHQALVKARLGKVREAVELLEKWRGRQIAERLEMLDFSLAGVADEDRESFLEVTRRISELQAAERDDVPDDLIRLIGAHQQARDERVRLVEKIRSYKPDFLCDLTYEDIQRAASDAEPLAFILATKSGTLTILVTAGGEPETIWCDDYSDTDFLLSSLNSEAAQSSPARGRDAVIVLGSPGSGQGTTRRLADATGRALIGPLKRRLREMRASGVTLLPCGALAYFPLHALADEQGGHLIDDVPVRYAPTARTLLTARDRLERQAVGEVRFLGVGNPTRDLPAAEPEVSGIATLFPPGRATVLLSDRATFDMVRQSLEGVTILHLACHGQFDSARPLESSLLLARGERLTLRAVLDGAEFSALRAARLAVLSACESARADLLGLPEEALGFPAAFAQAGVAGVVGTLWPVADLSTALLMLRFYQGLIHGRQAPATALREAQQWLRAVTRKELELACVDVPELRKVLRDFFGAEVNGARAITPTSQPFADPYFWAGFILVGV